MDIVFIIAMNCSGLFISSRQFEPFKSYICVKYIKSLSNLNENCRRFLLTFTITSDNISFIKGVSTAYDGGGVFYLYRKVPVFEKQTIIYEFPM